MGASKPRPEHPAWQEVERADALLEPALDALRETCRNVQVVALLQHRSGACSVVTVGLGGDQEVVSLLVSAAMELAERHGVRLLVQAVPVGGQG